MRITGITLIVLGLLLATGRELSAQHQIGIAPKDPSVAQLYALLCPGCGHLYTGETVKGAMIATVSVGAIFGGMVAQFNQEPEIVCKQTTNPFEFGQCETKGASLKPFLVGSAIGLAGYLYGLIDAGPSARRMRAREGLEIGSLEVQPALGWSGNDGMTMMLRLTPKR